MITIPAGVRVMIATRPVESRRGGDGLMAARADALPQEST